MNRGKGEGQSRTMEQASVRARTLPCRKLHVSVQTYFFLCSVSCVWWSRVPCSPACLRFPTPRSVRAESGLCAVDFVSPESLTGTGRVAASMHRRAGEGMCGAGTGQRDQGRRERAAKRTVARPTWLVFAQLAVTAHLLMHLSTTRGSSQAMHHLSRMTK